MVCSLISPSRTRELLIEVKDPALIGSSKEGHSHFFCVISVRDLLTTSNQTHIMPLLSFCRPFNMTSDSMTPHTTNQRMSYADQMSDRNIAEKPFYHYHYSTKPCHLNISGGDKQRVNHTAHHNVTEAAITIKVR